MEREPGFRVADLEIGDVVVVEPNLCGHLRRVEGRIVGDRVVPGVPLVYGDKVDPVELWLVKLPWATCQFAKNGQDRWDGGRLIRLATGGVKPT